MNHKLKQNFMRKSTISIFIGVLILTSILLYKFVFKDMRGSENTMSMNLNTYKNSFKLDQEWEDYGIGDPYILRFNGKYYLYCSTKDYKKGIKAWSSEDLISWKYEGLAAEEEVTTSAYAPEVVYWNGYFYMYTSPAGKGHYVLKSDSPTGPFTVQTKNFGLSIDGSVFIDDDGKFYFTHAGDKGIVANEMEDPLTVESSGKLINAYLNGWTEGSMIIKHNGSYYLTYTGNHVFSKGYRVNYAVSENSPVGSYTVPDNNPIIINTEEDFNGLGHSSTVMGPDMDSYYIIYHNLVGKSKQGPPVRQMNIDRVVFNGQRMSVLGPSNYEQPVPKKADFFTWLQSKNPYPNMIEASDKDNKIKVTDKAADNNYTAEFNFKLKSIDKVSVNSMVGAVFSYNDEKDYMCASINILTKELEVNRIQNGNLKKLNSVKLTDSFDLTKLHTIRVEKSNNSLKLYFDNMLKINMNHTDIIGGKIGYVYNNAEPMFDYIAFDNDTNDSSDYNTFKPVPGKIEAVHFLKGKGTGYLTENKQKDSFRQDSEIKTILTEDKTYAVELNKGEWIKYNINVKEDSSYGINFMVNSKLKDAEAAIYIDDSKIKTVKLNSKDNLDNSQWIKLAAGELNLRKGFHTLKIQLVKGELDIKWMDFYKLSSLKKGILDNWTYYGQWDVDGNKYSTNMTGNNKAFQGEESWGNYELKADININDPSSKSAILFRVTKESYFKDQVQDSFIGYRLIISLNEAVLEKVNYGGEAVQTSKLDLNADKDIHIKISAVNNQVNVYVDNMNKPVIEYKDDNAFMHGKVGIEMKETGAVIKNVNIKPVK